MGVHLSYRKSWMASRTTVSDLPVKMSYPCMMKHTGQRTKIKGSTITDQTSKSQPDQAVSCAPQTLAAASEQRHSSINRAMTYSNERTKPLYRRTKSCDMQTLMCSEISPTTKTSMKWFSNPKRPLRIRSESYRSKMEILNEIWSTPARKLDKQTTRLGDLRGLWFAKRTTSWI